MNKITYKFIIKLSLALVTTSCAVKPISYPVPSPTYPPISIPDSSKTPTQLPPNLPNKPNLPPQLPKNYPNKGTTLPPPQLPSLPKSYPNQGTTLPPPQLPRLPKNYPNNGTTLPPRLPTTQPNSNPSASSSLGSYSANSLTGHFANSTATHQFIQTMVQKHGFSRLNLNGLFSQAVYLSRVAQLENPTTLVASSLGDEAGSWSRYRGQFVTPERINGGVKFWQTYASYLNKAMSTYGVNPEYIVAIIGVETFYGRNAGTTRVIDALSTLAFTTPKRAKFFTSELENYLLFIRDEAYEPRKPIGSWAGAMGLGQFMPSSFRKLFVDFNKDGKRDLWNPEDVIGSVANYFYHSNWSTNQPVAEKSSVPFGSDIITLNTYQGLEYWKTYKNFKVIKTYNHKDHYVMAVHQLAQAIKQKMQ